MYPDTVAIQGDLTEASVYESVLSAAHAAQCDFLIATPPCQGMSTAGKQLKDDPRNRLITVVANAIETLKPKFALIENVPEMLQTKILVDGKWVYINDYLHDKLGELYRV